MAENIFPDFDGMIEAADVDESAAIFAESEEETIPYGMTWRFDFQNGDILIDDNRNFTEVSEQETLKEWIMHTLLTARGETIIFSDMIGTDIQKMIGAVTTLDSYALSRIEAQITDAIRVHDRIANVKRISVIPLGYDLFIYLKYVTDDGAEIDDLMAL